MDFSTIKGVTLPGNLQVKKMQHGNDVLWESGGEDYSKLPFFIQNETNTAGTVTIKRIGTSTSFANFDVYGSTDNTEWTLLGTTSTSGITATLPANGRLYLRATTNQWGYSSSNYVNIISNVNHDVCGNILSLLYGSGFSQYTTMPSNTYVFASFLENDEYLISANNLVLPSNLGGDYCYYKMFYGCSSLTTAPELPATTLTVYCYGSMFNECSSLTMAPELPATTLEQYCYHNMFNGCSSLTTAPELPATTLAYRCYYYMFYGCSSLTTAPELPATTLEQYCYYAMFQNCTSLTTAPELPATTLVSYCYYEMFRNCSSLTTAPELPATTLVSRCYYGMFRNCSSLNYIKAMFTTTPSTTYMNNWVYGVAATGTFVMNGDYTDSITSGASGLPSGWDVAYSYLTAPTITVDSNDLINITGNHYYAGIKYTIQPDGGSEGSEITVYENSVVIEPSSSCTVRACEFDALGNTSTITSYHVVVAPGLTLFEDRGISTFTNETSETVRMYFTKDGTTPTTSSSYIDVLPGEKYVVDKSEDKTWDTYNLIYEGLTSGLISNVKTRYLYPDLLYYESVSGSMTVNLVFTQNYFCGGRNMYYINNSNNLSDFNYVKEFNYKKGLSYNTVGRSSETTWAINTIAKGERMYLQHSGYNYLGASTYTDQSNYSPVYYRLTTTNRCNIGGLLSTFSGYSSVLTAYHLFEGDTNLVDASELSFGNSSITTVSGRSGSNYINYGGCTSCFSGCTSLIKAPKLPLTTMGSSCYNSMFLNCTSLTKAPELPATTLVENCYAGMFQGCSSLNYIKTMSTAPSTTYTSNWVYGVAASGLFIKNPEATWNLTGASGVPTGWTVSSYEPFYIEDISGNENTLTIKCPTTGSLDSFTVYISNNGGSWTELGTVTVGGNDIATTIPAYGKLYIGGVTDQWGIDAGDGKHTSINCSGEHNVGGDLRSLLNYSGYDTYVFANTTYQFYRLFYNDTTLVSAENLLFPKITLKSCCYRELFENCTSLIAPPEKLEATSLSVRCYQGMFKNCSSMRKSPLLLSTTLTTSCYEELFYGCSSLEYIYSLNTTTPSDSYTYNWVSGVAATGTFEKSGLATWNVVGTNGVPTGWVEKIDTDTIPFYVENLTGSSITLTFQGPTSGYPSFTVYYSSNGSSWSTLGTISSSSRRKTLSIPANSKRYLKTNASVLYASTYNYNNGLTSYYYSNISCNGNFAIGGNLIQLTTSNQNNMPIRIFFNLFQNVTNLVTAENLIMPSSTSDYCFCQMFQGCSSLTTAPELPATTLVNGCYNNMFQNCTNLNYIKAMFTTTPGTTYTSSWVNGVAATGTFVKNATATWNLSGVNGIPSGWTVETAAS